MMVSIQADSAASVPCSSTRLSAEHPPEGQHDGQVIEQVAQEDAGEEVRPEGEAVNELGAVVAVPLKVSAS